MINSSATLAIQGKPVTEPIPLNWEPCDAGAYCWIVIPDLIAPQSGHLQLFITDQRNVFIFQFKFLQTVEKNDPVSINVQLTIPFSGPVQAIIEDRNENNPHRSNRPRDNSEAG